VQFFASQCRFTTPWPQAAILKNNKIIFVYYISTVNRLQLHALSIEPTRNCHAGQHW